MSDELVLVTGATGLIGNAIAKRLHARGRRVRALVRDPDRAKTIVGDGIELVRGDVTDASSMTDALRDVSLVFHRCESLMHGGGVPRARALADELTAAWLNLARTGDPNGSGVSPWPAYTAERRSTLVLGESSEVVDDPLRELRLLWDELAD